MYVLSEWTIEDEGKDLPSRKSICNGMWRWEKVVRVIRGFRCWRDENMGIELELAHELDGE
jgi:hypothetical protein